MPLKRTAARFALPRWFVAIVLALLAGGTVALTVDTGGTPTTPVVTVEVTTRGPAGKPVTDVVPQAKLDEAANAPGDLTDDMRAVPPSLAGTAAARAGKQQADRLATGPGALPLTAGMGASEDTGPCRVRTVRNQSDRGGTRPVLLAVHYPVMANSFGWSDLLSLAGWLDNPAASVSYNRIFDWDSQCIATVPLARKAWAQAGFNRQTISYSMMGRGAADGKFAPPAALRFMAADMARTARKFRIPIRRGAVSGCTITRSGILDHGALGGCGGGHVDIRPWSIDAVIAEVRRQDAAQRAAANGRARERGRTCNQLRWHRAKLADQRPGRAGTKQRDAWTARITRIQTLKARAAAIGLDASKCK